jgi:hypothetical protein
VSLLNYYACETLVCHTYAFQLQVSINWDECRICQILVDEIAENFAKVTKVINKWTFTRLKLQRRLKKLATSCLPKNLSIFGRSFHGVRLYSYISLQVMLYFEQKRHKPALKTHYNTVADLPFVCRVFSWREIFVLFCVERAERDQKNRFLLFWHLWNRCSWLNSTHTVRNGASFVSLIMIHNIK